MKTTISVPDELFEEIEEVAKKNHYSRSELFVIAVREYLKKRRPRRLFAALNQAYAAAESPKENNVRQRSKKRYTKTVQRERY